MPNIQRYGLFRAGSGWCVAGDDDTRLDFTSFSEAVAATDLLIRAHHACGDACEILVQDRAGALVRLPDGEPGTLDSLADEILAGSRAAF
ncbi:hypothetical protein [Phenylobacterium sp.]|jgi:hypothetical protein|uniref:hypothetical protein n=1 Tax=Phenylobacterium sp. TaxID=1871053 RepID=UPI002E302280|nr:hypothetical protein [Phenylobacterium sp.]HEX4711914.1 hypothetical protein [Phenylobacterium sp.]